MTLTLSSCINIPLAEEEGWGALPRSCQVNVESRFLILPPLTLIHMCAKRMLITDGCGWKFWLFAELPLTASWLGGLGAPCYCSPCGLHWHYKEGTSLLLGGGKSPDFSTLTLLQWRRGRTPCYFWVNVEVRYNPHPVVSIGKTHLSTWPSLIDLAAVLGVLTRALQEWKATLHLASAWCGWGWATGFSLVFG